jgi:hypothetical protein
MEERVLIKAVTEPGGSLPRLGKKVLFEISNPDPVQDM